ncbi:MAG: TetR/AcrR family transcriptional regulator [Caulobacterales bacterium]
MSAELFNRYGIEAVSVGQISEALGMSPGNLTYHYNKKADLIAEHLNVFEKALQAEIDKFPVHSNAKSFAAAYMDMMDLTFRYRFLFLGANYLIQNDLVEMNRYEKLIKRTKQQFIDQIKRLVAEGFMTPVKKPYSIEMIVDSIWWTWLGWLLDMQLTPPAKRAPERKLLAEAALHVVFVNHHYIDQGFFKMFQAELKKLGQQSATVIPIAGRTAAKAK